MSEVPLYSRFTVAAHILEGIHAQHRSPGSSVIKVRGRTIPIPLRKRMAGTDPGRRSGSHPRLWGYTCTESVPWLWWWCSGAGY